MKSFAFKLQKLWLCFRKNKHDLYGLFRRRELVAVGMQAYDNQEPTDDGIDEDGYCQLTKMLIIKKLKPELDFEEDTFVNWNSSNVFLLLAYSSF